MEINEMLKIMETDIKEVLKCANLQKIRNFMFDNNSIESYNLTYNERLAESSISILKTLKKLCNDDENALDDAICDLNTAVIIYRDVFTEIGMKAGVRLLCQLLYE